MVTGPTGAYRRATPKMSPGSSAEFPRDKLGDVLGCITALVQLEPAEIYETTITA
jgi:hypothetical protein